MTRTRRSSRLLAATSAGLLVLAACGSDDTGSVPSPADTEASSTAELPPLEADSDQPAPDERPVESRPAVEVEGSADGPAVVSPEAGAAVPAILDFESVTVGGDRLDLATLAGRPVLLWFWAPF